MGTWCPSPVGKIIGLLVKPTKLYTYPVRETANKIQCLMNGALQPEYTVAHSLHRTERSHPHNDQRTRCAYACVRAVNLKAQFESNYWRGVLDAQGKVDGGYY